MPHSFLSKHILSPRSFWISKDRTWTPSTQPREQRATPWLQQPHLHTCGCNHVHHTDGESELRESQDGGLLKAASGGHLQHSHPWTRGCPGTPSPDSARPLLGWQWKQGPSIFKETALTTARFLHGIYTEEIKTFLLSYRTELRLSSAKPRGKWTNMTCTPSLQHMPPGITVHQILRNREKYISILFASQLDISGVSYYKIKIILFHF